MLFEDFVDVLGELFSAVFGEGRNRNANKTAVIGWIQAEIRSANRFFDWSNERNIVGLDSNESRVGSSELCDLIYRSRRSVIFDLDIIENGDRSSAGPDRRKFFADVVDRFLHSFADLCNLIFDCHSILYYSRLINVALIHQ